MLTNTEILQILKGKFSSEELKLFAKIEAEKLKLEDKDDIDASYDIEFWEKQSKNNNDGKIDTK